MKNYWIACLSFLSFHPSLDSQYGYRSILIGCHWRDIRGCKSSNSSMPRGHLQIMKKVNGNILTADTCKKNIFSCVCITSKQYPDLHTCSTEASSSTSPGLNASNPLISHSTNFCISNHVLQMLKWVSNQKQSKIICFKNKSNKYYFQCILFLSFFSMSPMPSKTFVMSYIRLFCTCIIRNPQISI